MNEAQVREHIEALVSEEHELLNQGEGAGPDPDRHARLEAVQAELDSCWDLLRRREAGQSERLTDAEVPDPPNELEGPDPEPRHEQHGV